MRNLFLIICLYIMVSPVWAAIDCNSIFPGPIQSHDTKGTLYMQSGARVEKYNGLEVCFKQVKAYNEEMNSLACGTGKCQITGKASLKQDSPVFPGSVDSSSYTIANWATPTVIMGETSNYGKAMDRNRWDIGNLTIDGSVAANGSGSLSFSNNYSSYVMRSVTLQNNGVMTFSAGKTYFIEGDLNLNSGTIKVIGNGATRIYIQGEFKAHSESTFQASEDLEIYIGSRLTFTGNNTLAGTYYVEGDATLENNVTLLGRISAKNVNLKGNSKVIYDDGQPNLECFNDDFSKSSLGDNWVVAQRNNSEMPSIQNGRLRMTRNIGNQATSATFQRLFPAASNLVTITFNHYAYNGSGADGIAVVLSDAKVTPQPGAFGGPLGYGFKPGISGFDGGWLGVGIDEYGNFSGEGGTINVGQRRQSVAVRGSGPQYNYLKGTCKNGTNNVNTNCLSPAVDGNGSVNHSYRLTVDSRISGQSMVKVERNTGSGYITEIDSFNVVGLAGQSVVPEDFLLSLTGSTGGSTNIHEIDNIQICALRSNPIGVQIDHFQLDYSGQPLTCNPEMVTVKACANAACTTLITDPVTATLSLNPASGNNGWIGGNTVSFSGGSTTVQLRNNTTTPVTIGVSSSTPTTKPGSSTLCKVGNGTPSVAACTLYFADSGLIFDVLDTYSNQPQDVTISAVKKDDITKQCVPGFTGVRSVGFWGTYNNPNTNNFGSKISIDGNAIATYAASVASPTPTTLNLTFDNQGKATLKKVAYPDAGQMQLSASHNGSSETAGLVMTGSDTFMARPVGLCITPPQGVCAAGDSSCPVFKKAGETFQVDIKAMAWESANDGDICAGNLITPNFVLSNIVLGSTLVAPNPGTNATLGITTYNHVAATNSVNTISQTVSEVGVFRMTATPPVNGYFNYTIPSAQSQPVGRFIPADFNLVSGEIVPACNAFSYMGQPFGVTLDVQARNTTGMQTQNYTGPFAKGTPYITVANNKDGHSLATRLTSITSLPWVNGKADFKGTTSFSRLSGNQPDGPYKSLLFGLYMRDEDGERSLIANPDFNDAVVGNCSGASCNARQIDSVPMKVYFGRLLAGTEAGVATAPLAIPLKMQYYEAGNWQPNKEDQCTRLSLAADGIRFLNPGHSFDAATRDLNLGAGRKIKLGLGSSAPGGDAAQAKDGEILFHFARPDISVRIPYKVDLAKQPLSPLWLSDPASANDGNLQGEAIFGSSRGNDRIIYRREVLH
ncbi:DUF6701 domain-containing protein [Aeromonas veronii]|uniref:DUF6701 domain-containing protein n=1 Tax=Aeromonas veronii TaxID=654 RepID=UPI003D219913